MHLTRIHSLPFNAFASASKGYGVIHAFRSITSSSGRLAGATALAPWLAACGGGGGRLARSGVRPGRRELHDGLSPARRLVGVRVGGEAPWMRAFGQADVARATPMTLDNTFPVRSVTKSFTVTLFLQLVQAGRLALDDKIERYVAGVPNGNLISLADLAGNQSGLADYSAQPAFFEPFVQDTLHVWTPQELLAFSFAVPPAFLPGEQYQYSNTNTVLLGLVIEEVTGQALGRRDVGADLQAARSERHELSVVGPAARADADRLCGRRRHRRRRRPAADQPDVAGGLRRHRVDAGRPARVGRCAGSRHR